MAANSFVNAIPNPARSKKSNGVTLDKVCEAAYQGDFKELETMLKSGDEDTLFNGDLNMHFTDLSALHLASMAGHKQCVELLLEAKADPHLRTVVPEGKDPQSGEKAIDKAKKFQHDNIAEILRKAEEANPPGRYQPDGICNNKKLYGDQKPTAVPKEIKVEAAAAPAAKPAAAKKEEKKEEPTKAEAKKDSLPVALLFPGQGSQYVKMLDGVKDLPEVKTMLEKAKEILGYDLLDLCLKGPEDKLAETQYCQPAMFVGGLAGVAKLRSEKGDVADRPQCVAGLSLGEYTALCAAGVFSFEDGLRLVKLRGEAMQEAAQVGKQGMVSVVGLERSVMDKLCDEAAKKAGAGEVAKVANVLFPKGFSCAGTEKAINILKDLSEKKGALQARLLKTSGGFHTSLMQPAQEKLVKALEQTAPSMQAPSCAVYMNVTGEPIAAGADPKVVLELLSKQLVNPVLWHNSVEKMIKDGVSEFYECGPQKQIKAMMKRIDNKVWAKTSNVEV
mmetsp:Transcript_96032/g.200607  ORF Transcript_96032/g.200607 Transcript_96032/m.200607 type:complete len:503 (-) Transcript_96032:444-1952(-)|eukprot:CAMPEP_0206455428 /NCGR_PEP_ID=MMETSP0324_2-20121206/21746_1 /ASSEMBLY_ACC=CAM_ASM_000836 /TAXON_ID=2866 /ORGANISM="Crypthecodinium cohnii, Strain Seligo" /LENGTH=502 /DNA_ID=CAMNT_0053926129 /DNA_START=74 /DNA_END=1582 /DNA_ORIENTATION=-